MQGGDVVLDAMAADTVQFAGQLAPGGDLAQRRTVVVDCQVGGDPRRAASHQKGHQGVGLSLGEVEVGHLQLVVGPLDLAAIPDTRVAHLVVRKRGMGGRYLFVGIAALVAVSQPDEVGPLRRIELPEYLGVVLPNVLEGVIVECKVELGDGLLRPFGQVRPRTGGGLKSGDQVAGVAAVVTDHLVAQKDHLLDGDVHLFDASLSVGRVLRVSHETLQQPPQLATLILHDGPRAGFRTLGGEQLEDQPVSHRLGLLVGDERLIVERIVFHRLQVGGDVQRLLLGQAQAGHLGVRSVFVRIAQPGVEPFNRRLAAHRG